MAAKLGTGLSGFRGVQIHRGQSDDSHRRRHGEHVGPSASFRRRLVRGLLEGLKELFDGSDKGLEVVEMAGDHVKEFFVKSHDSASLWEGVSLSEK